jgi:hypothetical protein
VPANYKQGVDWSEIKELVEDGKGDREISRLFAERGVSLSHVAIGKRRRKEQWGAIASDDSEWQPNVTPLACVQNPTNLGKRTGKRAKQICKHILRGVSPSNAASLCDMTSGALSMWRKEDPAFNDLIDSARRAHAATMEQKLTEIADRGDLRAVLAYLERSPATRDDWAPKGLTGQSGQIQITLNVPSPIAPVPDMITIEATPNVDDPTD